MGRTRVRLLGRPVIERPVIERPDAAGVRAAPKGQKAWAVLARVALAERPVSRRELAAELFADAEDPLGALRWSLADLRRALGVPVLTGDPLVLGEEVAVDVRELEQWPDEDLGGELLDGVDVRNCPTFDTWLLLERMALAARGREELRRRALAALAAGDAERATTSAGRAARIDPLDEDAQQLFLRCLVAAGQVEMAAAHLASCLSLFAREGLTPSAELRAAARDPRARPAVRASAVAQSLLESGTAALDAGAVDAGVETLRRAVAEADRSGDAALKARTARALGEALVHAVRGADGEGAVVLHSALAAARTAGESLVVADVLRELAYVDLQAGRHASAQRALTEATAAAGDDPTLRSGILALQGMNAADRGRHVDAAALLRESVATAQTAGRPRQEAWSLGLMARSLLQAGDGAGARAAAEASLAVVASERWNAFRPWPQVQRAQALAEAGAWEEAGQEAERAFALACELGDPCWEGMSGRLLGVVAMAQGDDMSAREWLDDARRRCDRVPDRYVWVSGWIGLGQALAATRAPARAIRAQQLYDHAVRADLPEFVAWGLVLRGEAGDARAAQAAPMAARGVQNPSLQARVRTLGENLPR